MLTELDRLTIWKLDQATADAFKMRDAGASREGGPPMTADARQSLAITEAVRAAVVDAITGRCPVDIAVSRVLAAIILPADQIGPAERPSERRNRANADALALLLDSSLRRRAGGAAPP